MGAAASSKSRRRKKVEFARAGLAAQQARRDAELAARLTEVSAGAAADALDDDIEALVLKSKQDSQEMRDLEQTVLDEVNNNRPVTHCYTSGQKRRKSARARTTIPARAWGTEALELRMAAPVLSEAIELDQAEKWDQALLLYKHGLGLAVQWLRQTASDTRAAQAKPRIRAWVTNFMDRAEHVKVLAEQAAERAAERATAAARRDSVDAAPERDTVVLETHLLVEVVSDAEKAILTAIPPLPISPPIPPPPQTPPAPLPVVISTQSDQEVSEEAKRRLLRYRRTTEAVRHWIRRHSHKAGEAEPEFSNEQPVALAGDIAGRLAAGGEAGSLGLPSDNKGGAAAAAAAAALPLEVQPQPEEAQGTSAELSTSLDLSQASKSLCAVDGVATSSSPSPLIHSNPQIGAVAKQSSFALLRSLTPPPFEAPLANGAARHGRGQASRRPSAAMVVDAAEKLTLLVPQEEAGEAGASGEKRLRASSAEPDGRVWCVMALGSPSVSPAPALRGGGEGNSFDTLSPLVVDTEGGVDAFVLKSPGSATSHRGRRATSTTTVSSTSSSRPWRHTHRVASALGENRRVELLDRLGSGAFGTVFVARLQPTGTYCVMKRMRLGKLGRRKRQEALGEVRIMACIPPSPFNVGYIHSFCSVDPRTKGARKVEWLNILMELCDKGDLAALLAKRKSMGRGPLSEWDVWGISIQLVLGLHHLHRNRVLHRDIKTQNIFVCSKACWERLGTNKRGVMPQSHGAVRYHVQIGDLGLARLLTSTDNFARSLVGTPYYLSPEMCFDRPYGTKTDCYALGCVIYQLCTLRPPFEANNTAALIFKIMQGRHVAIPCTTDDDTAKAAGRRQYSPTLRDLTSALLHVEPSLRPDTCDLLGVPSDEHTEPEPSLKREAADVAVDGEYGAPEPVSEQAVAAANARHREIAANIRRLSRENGLHPFLPHRRRPTTTCCSGSVSEIEEPVVGGSGSSSSLSPESSARPGSGSSEFVKLAVLAEGLSVSPKPASRPDLLKLAALLTND